MARDLARQRAALRVRVGTAIAVAGAGALLTFGALAALLPGDPTGALITAAVFGIGVALAAFWVFGEFHFARPISALTSEVRFLSEAARDSEIDPHRYASYAPLPALVNQLTRRLADATRQTDRAVAAATQRAQEEKSLLEGILRDLSEGVLVCSLDHRVLLYNQVALSILTGVGELGLGRSLFNVVTREPILHTLDRLLHRAHPADAESETTAPLVCATVDARALLRGRMTMITGPQDQPTGYILTLTDVTRDIAELNRRDRLLRDATEGLRSPLANLRAAAETLGSFPDIDPAQRRQFEQVVLREAEALAAKIEAVDRENRDLAVGHWPLADMHSVDLFNCVIRRLGDAGGPAVTMVGLPLWLHGDSHSLVVALAHLIAQLAAATGERQFDLEALLGDRRVYVEIAWHGAPVAEATIETWLREELPEALGAQTLGDVLFRHSSEIWSRPKPTTGEGRPRAVLRLPLPAPMRIQFQPQAAAPLPARPEFYDFDLMHLAPADRSLEARPLRNVPYVVFDTETTGLNPSQGDEIIAIGAVRIVSGRILTGETFTRLVNPGRVIPPASIRFHNITDTMVEDAPPIAVVLPQFRSFVGDAVLVAHNAAFDLKFIKLKEAESGTRFSMLALDTMLISMFLYPDFGDHSLDRLAARLGVEVGGRHSALGDALATAGVFVRLLDLLENRGITTLGGLVRASNMALDIRLRQEQF